MTEHSNDSVDEHTAIAIACLRQARRMYDQGYYTLAYDAIESAESEIASMVREMEKQSWFAKWAMWIRNIRRKS